MNDNSKARAPKLAITKPMIDAGKAALDALTAEDLPVEVTDDQLVAQIFFNMWNVYWEEIIKVGRKKKAGSPIIQKPQGIILPFRN